MDEFAGFIEEDEFSDDDGEREEEEIRRREQKMRSGILSSQFGNIDNDKLGELYDIFGDGEEYLWALNVENSGDYGEEAIDEDNENNAPALQDVFEPSELKERMLTEEDNTIRVLDVPERYQALRASFKDGYNLTPEEFEEEQEWVASTFIRERNFTHDSLDLKQPTFEACKIILDFLIQKKLEVPFIWYHRRDYTMLLKGEDSPITLLECSDLWRLLQLDIEYHAVLEKRRTVEKLYKSIEKEDEIYVEENVVSGDILSFQDLFDYLQFQYSGLLRTLNDQNSKRHSRFGLFERIRNDKLYNLVRAIGITANEVAENISSGFTKNHLTDAEKTPTEMIDEISESEDTMFHKTEQAVDAVKQMFAEELFHNPKIRRSIRSLYDSNSVVSITLTEKGRNKIDEKSPYFNFKYAANLSFEILRGHPEQYLKMLEAEYKGLVIVIVHLPKGMNLEDIFSKAITSDNRGLVPDSWNKLRTGSFQISQKKLESLMSRNIKEDLKRVCERQLLFDVRKAVTEKISHAPFKPAGYKLGTVPRVLSISSGFGDFQKDAVLSTFIDEDYNVLEHIKFDDDPKTGEFRKAFVELVNRRKPDVIGISGFNINANRLHGIISEIITEEELKVHPEHENEAPIPLVWVQDEIARLFQNSDRAISEFPGQPVLGRYCVALARYLQSPLLEYANIGHEIVNINFHPNQALLNPQKLQEAIETVLVDIVNTVGIDINRAVKSSYHAAPLQYVAGLGPRKASGILQGIQSRGSVLTSRAELVIAHITTKNIFMNCSSFLWIPYDNRSIKNEETEMLDATRIHPEDYELARKMAADALDLDEEDLLDVEAGKGVIAQLINDDAGKLNDLILSGYSKELYEKINIKKRSNLELIKEELQSHYEEERSPYHILSESEVFTLLTGETNDTLSEGMVVPVQIRRIESKFLSVRLSCMIDGNITQRNMSENLRDRHPSVLFHNNQTISAKVLSIDRRAFTAELSALEREVNDARRNTRRQVFRDTGLWDFHAEQDDRNKQAIKKQAEQRSSRVIKHPLFRNFSSKQAEKFLEHSERGDVVIRPSSRGLNHLAITWKVDKNLYQHLDVLEHDKPNEYTIGKILEVDRKKYSDLDELILYHVKSMAKKVDELAYYEKSYSDKQTLKEKIHQFQKANPSRAYYGFTINTDAPGYFWLYIKPPKSEMLKWNVKVVPEGYSLAGKTYPLPLDLCNGLKYIMTSKAKRG